MRPRLLYVVTEDWYFLSHRLPMARAAKAAGFDVHVATRVVDGRSPIEAEGFTLHHIAFARGQLSPGAAFDTIRSLRRLHDQIAPALCHHVAVQASLLGLIAAAGKPAACINALTGLGYAFSSGAPKARALRFAISHLLRLMMRRADRVALVQNPVDRDDLIALGLPPGRIVLIPGSGVETETLRPLPEPPGPVTVGFVGRLLDDKGIRTLVDAHRLLRRRRDDIRLLIAGTPDPANPTSVSEDEAKGWSKEPGIEWLGHVRDIPGLWARAHIAVLPSRREGLPKSLLEAAACGRPMIATDVPGCQEIVRHDQTGLLVPPDDAAALAETIERFADAPDLRARFGASARQLVEAEFSAAAIGRQIVNLYRTFQPAAS